MRYTRKGVATGIVFCVSLALAASEEGLAQSVPLPIPTSIAAPTSTFAGAATGESQSEEIPDTYSTVFDAEFNRAKEALRHDALTKTTTLSVNESTKAVTATNAATTAPDGFATRIHSSFQDYLNLLAFAINKVDESKDGQSLIIRLNAIRSGPSLLAGTLTLSKPGVYQPILDSLPVASQANLQGELEKELTDLDDVTFGLAYSLATKSCSLSAVTGRCYGRDPHVYRALIEDLLGVAANPETPEAKTQRLTLARKIKGLNRGVPSLMNSPINRFSDPKEARDLIEQLARLQAAGTLLEQDVYTKAGFGLLENLIDNQPQVSVVATYRSVGQLEGPDEWTVGLALQWGAYNLNRLRRESLGQADAAARLLKTWDAATVGDDGKFVLTATFKQRPAYSLTAVEVNGTPVPGFTPISQPSSSELSARVQWGTKIEQKVAGKKPRVDVLIDALQTWNDDVRTKNRVVGTVTLTVPAGDTISIPVSLNYANKPEFLGQQSKQLGAHLGVTYRIPGSSPNP